MTNHLRGATSPYLLQHAENPVDWYPWGPEALALARAQDKPIFLSVGYAACHWCHVMAHESFEDPETAALLNAHFVSIKVDREERPDLDAIYMEAVQTMTGQGGWPMSVFLTPDGRPFFGGTYFPPTPRHNLPSFRQVLQSVASAWGEQRDALLQSTGEIVAHLAQSWPPRGGATPLSASTLDHAAEGLLRAYDWTHGGWGAAPKFPQPMAIEILLGRYHRQGDRLARDMAIHALRAMASGGIFDQLGGGFHRYAVDADWRIPHFEKMLYDNALLARAFLHGYQVIGDDRLKEVATRTLDFILREMADPAGGFSSSLDADSEGIEGKYYTWTTSELRDALGDPRATELCLAAWGLTDEGDLEGRNVLVRQTTIDALAERFGSATQEIEHTLAEASDALLRFRSMRPRPFCDNKVLAEWNGLLLIALAEAARSLGSAVYLRSAERLAAFLLEQMTETGRLHRSWREGRASGAAFLADEAAVGEGMLALYQTDFNPRWFQAAVEHAERILTHFSDPSGGFFDTQDDQETPITRPKSMQDSPIPSGNALAATMLLHLASLTGENRYQQLALSSLTAMQGNLQRYPTAFPFWISALDLALGPVLQLAVSGDPDDGEFRALVGLAWRGYWPRLVVAGGPPGAAGQPALLSGRGSPDGASVAYLCREFVCQLPVRAPSELAAQLEEARRWHPETPPG